MAGLIDALMKAIVGNGDNKKKIIDPALLQAEQAANGVQIPTNQLDTSDRNQGVTRNPFATNNPKAQQAAEQLEIQRINDELEAEELARAKKGFGANNPKAGFMPSDPALLNDFIQSETRAAADQAAGFAPGRSPNATDQPQNFLSQDDKVSDFITKGMGIRDREITPGIEALTPPENVQDRNIGHPLLDVFKQQQANIADQYGLNPPHQDRFDKMNTGAPAVPSAPPVQQTPTMPDPKADPYTPRPNVDPAQTAATPESAPIPTDSPANQYPSAPEQPAGGRAIYDPYQDKNQRVPSPNDLGRAGGNGGGLGNLFGGFDFSVIGPALAVLDPRNAGLAGALMAKAEDRRNSNQKQKTLEQFFLRQEGMSPEDAKLYSENPELAKQWWERNEAEKAAAADLAKEQRANEEYRAREQFKHDLTGDKPDAAQIALQKDQNEAAAALPTVESTYESVSAAIEQLDNTADDWVGGTQGYKGADAYRQRFEAGRRFASDETSLRAQVYMLARQGLKGQGQVTEQEANAAADSLLEGLTGGLSPADYRAKLRTIKARMEEWRRNAYLRAGKEFGGSTQPEANSNAGNLGSKYGLY